MPLSRRNLLRTGWKACGALLASAAAWTTWELLSPLRSNAAGGKLRIGSPADFTADTATYVREGRFWLANANGHLFALSQKCPHLGCRVPFCESSGHFECPCHGSTFDIAGEWISGPAPRGMDQFEVGLDGDTLVVDTTKHIAGPDHGAKAFFKPAKGPSCREGA